MGAAGQWLPASTRGRSTSRLDNDKGRHYYAPGDKMPARNGEIQFMYGVLRFGNALTGKVLEHAGGVQHHLARWA